MTSLTQYIVPCIDEGKGVLTGFINTFPTTCPNNNTHTIDSTGIRVIKTITEKIVTINQNGIMSGNFYRTDFYSVPVLANSVTIKDITYPYNINVYLATYLPTTDNIGDTLDVFVAPNATCGQLAQDILAGVTTLVVTAMSITLNPGFIFSITDGVNTDDLGEIVSIDSNNNIIFTVPTVHAFTTGSLLKISIPRIKNCKFVNDKKIVFGRSKVGSSGLPANAKIRFVYNNNSNVDKTLNFSFEIGY